MDEETIVVGLKILFAQQDPETIGKAIWEALGEIGRQYATMHVMRQQSTLRSVITLDADDIREAIEEQYEPVDIADIINIIENVACYDWGYQRDAVNDAVWEELRELDLLKEKEPTDDHEPDQQSEG